MPLLEVKDLQTWFPVKSSWFSKTRYIKAVDGVSLSVEASETVGLVGESGCGKSTLGRTIVRLEKPTAGQVLLDGQDISAIKGAELRNARSKFQMIFQDPYGSLNPRMSVLNALDEVLQIHTGFDMGRRYERMCELMWLVGLREEQLKRYPHQFSGGQRQRIGIARALAVEPKIIIADEPVSALDVSVQAQIINLLIDIQKKTGISFLFIAHDLAVVEHVSSRILVMYLGRIVESGPSAKICSKPAHPYTKALLSSVPTLDPQMKRKRIILEGDVPSPISPPQGCHFHPRCPIAQAICSKTCPALESKGDDSRLVACHFPKT